MKTILVPTDFTPVSDNALNYAIALAKKLRAKITLIHAYNVFPFEMSTSGKELEKHAEIIAREAEERLIELCWGIEENSHCPCEYINSEGLAADVVSAYVGKLMPEMLVIGTENRSAVDKFLFGTITGDVLKEVKSKLWVVPEDTPFKPPRKMAFAVDYHTSDLDDIRFMVKLARKFKAEIHIIHIVTSDEDLDFEKSFFQDFKSDITGQFEDQNFILRLLKGKNIVEELEDYIEVEDIDVLAVARTQRNAIEKLFYESVSEKLFRNIKTPLLIFHAERLAAITT